MMVEDAREILMSLDGISEAYRKHVFTCVRATKEGGQQMVDVEILDAGPDSSDTRYHATAKSENGKTASGNPASSIKTVLCTLHWYQLD